jgi:YggT family protein
MGAIIQIANLLVQTLFTLYITVVLLRFILQLSRADFYNPISQFLVKATAPLLNPLRRAIPGVLGVDVSSLVLALGLHMIATVLLLTINNWSLGNYLLLPLWAVLGCLNLVVKLYFFAIIASIVLSWVAPGSYHPAILLLNQITEPVMAPFRKIIPPMGGLDLSPIFVFIAINILQIIITSFAASVGISRQASALIIGF